MNETYTLEKLFDEKLPDSFPGGICVPRIQRGYVQGRDNDKGKAIRAEFVPALVNAVFGMTPLSLDFLYGVADAAGIAENKKRLLLLDGQQRLTTLALLAWLCGKWRKEWRFDYEARRIPQLFMEGLLRSVPPSVGKPSDAVLASSWFLPVWQGDSSVAGMLRMLDALDEKIGSRDRTKANIGNVTFLLHSIKVGSGGAFDHIFRKMNARGKELSSWENMKAMLDKHVPDAMADSWRDKIDGDWAECLWEGVERDIAKLDNALEKIARMSYARVVGLERQNDTLWQIDGELSVDGTLGKQGSSELFRAMSEALEAICRTSEGVASRWTTERTMNALWGKVDDGGEGDFWAWLSDGKDASPSNLLRLVFLSEPPPHCKDRWRRCRILLNLLDAAPITSESFNKALEGGLGFLRGSFDLCKLKERRDGYSSEQLNDEIRKWPIDESAIVSCEKDDLVSNGSLRFIGWTPFRDGADIRERLKGVRSAIAGRGWLDFYQDLVSRISAESFAGRYAYTPRCVDDVGVWKDFILNDGRFIAALASWHTSPDNHLRRPAWVCHLADLLRTGKVDNPTLRGWDGWMFLLQNNSRRSANSIRLDRNEIERENRQLLKAGEVYYAVPWPFAEGKDDGVLYNVCDSSWWNAAHRPKATIRHPTPEGHEASPDARLV